MSRRFGAAFDSTNWLDPFVDNGGLFVVHIPIHVGDQEAARSEPSKGADRAIGLLGNVEQDSALLATEVNDFLIRMGVSRKLLTDVMNQQKAVATGDGANRPGAVLRP